MARWRRPGRLRRRRAGCSPGRVLAQRPRIRRLAYSDARKRGGWAPTWRGGAPSAGRRWRQTAARGEHPLLSEAPSLATAQFGKAVWPSCRDTRRAHPADAGSNPRGGADVEAPLRWARRSGLLALLCPAVGGGLLRAARARLRDPRRRHPTPRTPPAWRCSARSPPEAVFPERPVRAPGRPRPPA